MNDCRKKNGNCSAENDPNDGLPVQCVGPWAEDKHFYLTRYLDATKAVRAKFIPPQGRGGAAFVDLFAGPGRARIDSPRKFIDGSPLVALAQAAAPFTNVILCDIEAENVDALRARVANAGKHADIVDGDCNDLIDKIVAKIPRYGFNVALIDPYAASHLKFETVAKLASVGRMDLIIHFPLMAIKRNFSEHAHIEQFLGLPRANWGIDENPENVIKLIEVYRGQLERLGYEKGSVRSPAIKNTKNLPLYHLVFASRAKLGEKIWNSISKIDRRGQGTLF